MWVAWLVAVATLPWAASAEAPTASDATVERDLIPRPKGPASISPAEVDGALDRGRKFLVGIQNADGSFGSPENTKDLNIIAGVGSHHGFRVATTALCVQALIEEHDGSDDLTRAIEKGEEWLFEELPKVRRDNPMLIYNVWAHGYGIQALVAMHGRLPDDAARREQIAGLIRGQYEKLEKYESAEGGWGYYDFKNGTQRPASSSISFVNAMVLVAFADARGIGVPPPEKITKRAVAATEMQMLPDFSYLYGSYLRNKPRRDINRPAGSLGRTQACNLALRLWGNEKITDQVYEDWLDRLVTRNGWLDLGRKRPIPHESFFQVAGYFYYFGHYYAGRVIEQLPLERRPFYQDHLARIVIDVQDADGSWWDYPLYNYHQQYGTAYAIMTLHRCRRPPE
ncbi:MAG: hypothetical protein DWH79_04865 [Planctomycetota bacterium]|nr:MAG: hypothetical protein DWH79_04865 [Planctomycetota bacterium]